LTGAQAPIISKSDFQRRAISAVLLGRNPVLFDTLGAKELDSGLKTAGMTGGRFLRTGGG
jgi:hypothetical protein